MNFEIEKGHYVNFDLYANVAGDPDKIYETVDYIKGEKLPQPYVFVIDKSTEKIIQYPDIVLSENGETVLCKETRTKMESDDSVITMFDYDFLIVNNQYETYVNTNRNRNTHNGNDYLPFVYTKTDNGYLMFHKYTCVPFYDHFFDTLHIICPIGSGSSVNNLPLIMTTDNDYSVIYIEDYNGKWFPDVKPIYETHKHIENITYTRHKNSSDARWILCHHQIIIQIDGNTEILTIEGYNKIIRTKEFNNTIITPLDACGEFLLVDTKDAHNYVVRADKDGYHKASIIHGWTGTEKIQLPKNMSYMNCLRKSYDNDISYICDEDTDTIYVLREHYKKSNFMSMKEVDLNENDYGTWRAMYKKGDTWYLKYRVRIAKEELWMSSYPTVKSVLLNQNTISSIYIGNINKGGVIEKEIKHLKLPEYIEIPAYKKQGNIYVKYKDIADHDVSPISISADARCEGLIIDAMITNISTLLRGKIPFDNMHIYEYQHKSKDIVDSLINKFYDKTSQMLTI